MLTTRSWDVDPIYNTHSRVWLRHCRWRRMRHEDSIWDSPEGICHRGDREILFRLRHTETILAEHWDTAEYVLVGDETVWLYQDVYRLKDMNLHTRFVEAMLGTSTFAADPDKFHTVDIPGFDKVYTTKRLECIVVKGELIAYIAFPFDTDERVEEILAVLSEKWN